MTGSEYKITRTKRYVVLIIDSQSVYYDFWH